MTEITASINIYQPRPRPQTHLVDPVAFALAIVGGPVLVGLLGAPALLIPSFAAVMGGPVYVAVGTPVMLWALARRRSSPSLWASRALFTHLAIFLPLTALAAADQVQSEQSAFFLAFGLLFAPNWGLVSGWLYQKFERDFYKPKGL